MKKLMLVIVLLLPIAGCGPDKGVRMSQCEKGTHASASGGCEPDK